MSDDPLLRRLVSAFSGVPGIAAIVLGGSRARRTAHAHSDYDIGLYCTAAEPLDTSALLTAAKSLADNPDTTTVTPVGEWGPWIVGGAWLSIGGRKVDLLYRSIDDVADVIAACGAGRISMDYQPGHPHGFCSAIWAGEVALCRSLHDPRGAIAGLKAVALPYPPALRDALLHRFQWEVRFAIENAELAAASGEQIHVAGCTYRALACTAQVLFALNGRYLINEKGALREAAGFPLTLSNLPGRVGDIWRHIGDTAFAPALTLLRQIEQELKTLAP